jgi:phospholipid/cholesterol/gamma-HCH transport system substrate-binding protein
MSRWLQRWARVGRFGLLGERLEERLSGRRSGRGWGSGQRRSGRAWGSSRRHLIAGYDRAPRTARSGRARRLARAGLGAALRLPVPARVAVAATVPLLLVAGSIGLLALPRNGSHTITADFSETPGLYKDNHVDVLGIPVGTVVAVIPHPGYVAVRMRIRDGIRIPAGATALLEAPDVVNDRFVELTPAYTGGPVLATGGVIPVERTEIPVSTDEILRNLDQLVIDLGPTGANRHGAVSEVVGELARTLGGNGPALNRTITATGRAFGALAEDGPSVKALLDNLGSFTRAAAADSASYQTFVTDLATVTDELAADDADIGGALHNLQTALRALARFVDTNRATLGGSVVNLDRLFATLAGEQRELAGTLGVAPTALENITNAINPDAPGGPALESRYDPTTGSSTVADQVCGNTLLRLLILTVDNPPVEPGSTTASSLRASPLDVVCGFSSVLEHLGTPPNSPSGPLTDLQTLTGGGS